MIPDPRSKPTLREDEAAPLMGIALNTFREARRRGELPFPVWQIGRRIVIPCAPFLAALGLLEDAQP